MASPLISIVVPVFNEVDSLEPLVGEIRQVAAQTGLDLEVVLVDDGSDDGSWSKIVALAGAEPATAGTELASAGTEPATADTGPATAGTRLSIGGIRFRTNAGKAAALMAGFAAARGDLVVTMDADLQDPPEEIPRLIGKIDQGFDVVSGWKRIRHDPWHKVYPSRVFNKLIGWLTGVRLHDHVCGLKCFRRQVVEELRIYGGLYRFLTVLAAAKGHRVTEIPTLHRPRTHGVGKYGFTRFFKGLLDLLTVWCLTRFRWRPQHLIGSAGLVIILLNLLLVTTMPCLCLIRPVAGLATKLIVILVPGLTLITIGLVAELIAASGPIDDLYTIEERVGWCATPPTREQAN